jgi:hypothetical protein
MNINWEIIKEKYPKGYVKYRIYYCGFESSLLTGNNTICYCDLEKFFDDNEFIIEIINWTFLKEFMFYINWYGDSFESEKYNSRKECKEQAIYKAFEILENKLKEG